MTTVDDTCCDHSSSHLKHPCSDCIHIMHGSMDESRPSKSRMGEEGEISIWRRRVKYSLFGPPPSTAGSPSNTTFIGLLKSNSRFLKKLILSVNSSSLLIAILTGVLASEGVILCKISLLGYCQQFFFLFPSLKSKHELYNIANFPIVFQLYFIV